MNSIRETLILPISEGLWLLRRSLPDLRYLFRWCQHDWSTVQKSAIPRIALSCFRRFPFWINWLS